MKIRMLSEKMKDCNNIVFLGGAGVSTESGVKDYRSDDGLYNTVKEYGVSPEDILSINFFRKNPEVFYDFFRKHFVIEAEPNAAHKALAKLEKMGKLRAVITQNIDNLHQKAGSREVVELHGNTREFHCNSCRKAGDAAKVMAEIMSGGVPKCDHCGGVMRPNVVMYGELLHESAVDRALDSIANADMLIVGGTSLMVNPAASFVKNFKGKYFVIINETETPYDNDAHLLLRDKIGEVLGKAVDKISRL